MGKIPKENCTIEEDWSMKFRVLKGWINSIPDEYLGCYVVCSTEGYASNGKTVRIDRPVIGLAIDPHTNEVLIKTEYNEDLDKVD